MSEYFEIRKRWGKYDVYLVWTGDYMFTTDTRGKALAIISALEEQIFNFNTIKE